MRFGWAWKAATLFASQKITGRIRFLLADVQSAVDADIAQLVEQRIRNAKVGGSTPLIGTIISFLSMLYVLKCDAVFSSVVQFLSF